MATPHVPAGAIENSYNSIDPKKKKADLPQHSHTNRAVHGAAAALFAPQDNSDLIKVDPFSKKEWFKDRDDRGKLTEEAKAVIEKVRGEAVRRKHFVSKKQIQEAEDAFVTLDAQDVLRKKPKGRRDIFAEKFRRGGGTAAHVSWRRLCSSYFF